MNYQNNLQRAIELGNSAVDAENAAMREEEKEQGAGNFQAVLNKYTQALQHWMYLIKYEQNPAMKSRLKQQMESYFGRAEQLKKFISDRQNQKGGGLPHGNSDASVDGAQAGSGAGVARRPPEADSGGHSANGGSGDAPKSAADKEKEALQKQLDGAILTEKPNVKWDDIAGLQNAKDIIKETVILPQKFPQLFQGNVKPWKGILLYGPPGTGKSYLAKAVATEADATFYSLSSSDLVSKWQGESEKLVKNLFAMARANKPSVIFIDEVDSLAGSRGEGESESARRIKTEFLTQMDGVGNDVSGILTLGATNCPWDLDQAIRRRFEKRIYIPLPEVAARVRLLELGIGSTPVTITESDKQMLAEKLEGYSGSDMNIVCRTHPKPPINYPKPLTG